MALFVLVLAAILIVAAVRNSQGALFAALKTDVPAYVVWAAAIVAIGMVGYIPGLKPISRGLLGLIILVIIVNDYQEIISGFQQAWQGGESNGSGNSTASTSPANSHSISSNLNSAASSFGSSLVNSLMGSEE